MRNWKRTKERFEENKARIKKDCFAVLAGMSAFSWEKYSAALEARGYKVKLKMDASVTVRGYSIQSGNSVYKSSVIGRELTPSRIQETWEKMRPENRYGQMTDGERVSFMLSDEGADYLFGFTIKADGKDYHVSLPGRVIKVLGDEQVQSVRANPEEKNNGAFGLPSCSLPVMSMPQLPSRKTAEAADPLPTRTGVVTRTRTTSSGPAVASARRERWLLRR